MHKNRFLAVLGAFLLAGAGRPLQASIATDSEQSARWISEQLADAMAFASASTPLLPGSVCGLLGFEAGVGGGIAATDLDVRGYRNLSFTTLDNKGSEISIPDDLPVPVGLLHAKVGLPGGLDLGLKVGKVRFDQKEGDADFEFENALFGLEVRKRLLGGGVSGLIVPDLAVSLAYDTAKGEVTRKERYNGPITGGTLDAQTAWKSEWDAGALTARAVVSKKLLIVTPFVGGGFSKLLGSADTTATVTGTSNPGNVSVAESAAASADADGTVGHFLAGVEISLLPLVRLNLGYLSAKDHWSASGGLRVQFR